MSGRAFVVALCGIDGTGKTTLFRRLEERFNPAAAAFVPRGPSPAERLVARTYPRTWGDHRDWVDADFGNAVAVACALDFCAHHEATLLTLQDSRRLIVSDRYSTCFTAFARSLRAPEELALRLLGTVPPPDLILFLTAREEVIRQRLEERLRRGEAAPDEFEHPDCQRRLLGAYRELFAAGYPSRIVEIDNSGDIAGGLAGALAALRGVDAVEASLP
jgi:thymidylate kinase